MKTLFRIALLCLCLAGVARADGSAFFLLSDATHGSQQSAQVRLEAKDLGAIAGYGGVDVYVYRVKKPLDFLKAQKNLHRVNVRGNYVGEGLGNVLGDAWDHWWIMSRRYWRAVFSSEARDAVTAQSAEVRTHPLQHRAPAQPLNPRYQPLKNHTLVDSFRYPVEIAKPIEPPKGVKLAGSSSNFIEARAGNVQIPLGKLEPGLYLVEAMSGDYRAVTLVFVSDSIAVTKVSGEQMLVWLAHRDSGKPSMDARVVWSDGVGVLGSSATDGRGIATFQRSAPEKTYVYGEDAKGGVFVAENFYYDSEIYNTKFYAVTDRPLYRPGETVFVKFHGRTFLNARDSKAIEAGALELEVFDAGGFPVAKQKVPVQPQTGGATQFTLPDNAVAGGYELRFAYKGESYGAAFRVAQYQKPHFEIGIQPAKKDFKTREAITGRLQLTYPDGKPVANARVEMTVRAQQLSMVGGDLAYAGQFPVKLDTEEFTTDAKGLVSFKLPAANEPSRYVVSVLATDGAAYRVRATKEILVERGAATFSLRAPKAFSAVGERVNFAIGAQGAGEAPASWDWVQLESRKRANGKLSAADRLELSFAEAGTYTINLRDAAGNLVGAASHHVSGAGVKAPEGAILMVFDKTEYRPGETASALITFPQPVDEALLTLERDRVEKTALLANASGWIRTKRISPQQWRIEMPVEAAYAPNITLSAAFVQGGEYAFQNLGLKVALPRVEVAVRADKAVYAPGEKVTLDLSAALGGKPVAGATLAVGVVDEMVYVLQPEIAPDIFDFFYHPRRNNVRTSASLNFIGYDLAAPPLQAAVPARGQTPQRAIKLLERPRREDKDTAFWQPEVRTDAQGRATVSFTMPDSLTRWRVTVRAIAPGGEVGQSLAYLRSDKDFYAKWTSPNWLRAADQPVASVAIFNQTGKEAQAELTVSGGIDKKIGGIALKPGANFVALPFDASIKQPRLNLALAVGGKPVDALAVPLTLAPKGWSGLVVQNIALTAAETPIKLPADARQIRVQLADSANLQFRRLIDDLIDYPYGCAEQTASRLIPYSLALSALQPADERLAASLRQKLNGYRFRLAQMAGPNATFGWWSVPEEEGDAFVTAYAYYADWHASRALGIALPQGHFDRLLEVYRKGGQQRPVWQRAVMLYWMHEMGLPVRSLAEALSEQAAGFKPGAKPVRVSHANSLVMVTDDAQLQPMMALVLSAHVAQRAGGKLAPKVAQALPAATQFVAQTATPLTDALLMLTGARPSADAAAVLEKVRSDAPTIDRSLILLWSYRALGGNPALLRQQVYPDARRAVVPALQPHRPAGLPLACRQHAGLDQAGDCAQIGAECGVAL
jgi:alpha-2-macroglobulin